MEDHLYRKTFLVGERVTLADLFAASIFGRAFQYVLDKKWRDQHPNITRWYEAVHNVSYYAAVAGELTFVEEAIDIAGVGGAKK